MGNWKINRFILASIGYVLYGDSWKTQLARTMGYSGTSNTVFKILRNEYRISHNASTCLDEAITAHIELLKALQQEIREFQDHGSVWLNSDKNSKLIITNDGIRVGSIDEVVDMPVSKKNKANYQKPFLREIKGFTLSGDISKSILIQTCFQQAVKLELGKRNEDSLDYIIQAVVEVFNVEKRVILQIAEYLENA